MTKYRVYPLRARFANMFRQTDYELRKVLHRIGQENNRMKMHCTRLRHWTLAIKLIASQAVEEHLSQ